MKENLFEFATRNKLRFPSTKGDLSAEQLWDVPLRSKDGFNLDAIAKKVNAELKTTAEESFVDDNRRNPDQSRARTQLDIVKHVIAFRLDEEDAREKRAEKKAEYEKLLASLEKKQDAKRDDMSEAQIKKRLAEIGADL